MKCEYESIAIRLHFTFSTETCKNYSTMKSFVFFTIRETHQGILEGHERT